jgi:Ca2+-binding EF-hand superfamily protein
MQNSSDSFIQNPSSPSTSLQNKIHIKTVPLHEKQHPYLTEHIEARKARIRSLFNQLDDRNQGYIDASRYLEIFLKIHLCNLEYNNFLKSIARRLDDLVLGGDEPRQKPLPKPGHLSQFPIGSSVMYARELVKVCDRTFDGRITLIEFEAFVNAKEEELWSLFCHLDVGNDNALHLSDLQTSVRNAGKLLSMFVWLIIT